MPAAAAAACRTHPHAALGRVRGRETALRRALVASAAPHRGSRRAWALEARQGAVMPLVCGDEGAASPAEQEWEPSRRSLLGGGAAAMVAALHPCGAVAAAAGEKMARNKGDLYYPQEFVGVWECNSVLTGVETPQGDGVADTQQLERARASLGETVVYNARFYEFKGQVIADRAFTTRSLTEATVPGMLVGVSWTPEAPSGMRIKLSGGLNVQSTVTERGQTDVMEGRDQRALAMQEVTQQVFDNMRVVNGPPSVKASMIDANYTWPAPPGDGAPPPTEIKATQDVTMFAAGPGMSDGGDPLTAKIDLASLGDAVLARRRPLVRYRYEVTFRRLQGQEAEAYVRMGAAEDAAQAGSYGRGL